MDTKSAKDQPSLWWVDEGREGIALRELEDGLKEVQVDGSNCLVRLAAELLLQNLPSLAMAYRGCWE